MEQHNIYMGHFLLQFAAILCFCGAAGLLVMVVFNILDGVGPVLKVLTPFQKIFVYTVIGSILISIGLLLW